MPGWAVDIFVLNICLYEWESNINLPTKVEIGGVSPPYRQLYNGGRSDSCHFTAVYSPSWSNS